MIERLPDTLPENPLPLLRGWLDRALDEVRKHIEQIIGDCRRRMAADPSLYEQPGNFLEAVIAAQREHGEEFADNDIYANVLTLMLAGEDTTANTIGWAAKFFIDSNLREQDVRRFEG